MALTKICLIYTTYQKPTLIPCSCDCHIASLLTTLILVAAIVIEPGPILC
jgi:hypothetical protein